MAQPVGSKKNICLPFMNNIFRRKKHKNIETSLHNKAEITTCVDKREVMVKSLINELECFTESICSSQSSPCVTCEKVIFHMTDILRRLADAIRVLDGNQEGYILLRYSKISTKIQDRLPVLVLKHVNKMLNLCRDLLRCKTKNYLFPDFTQSVPASHYFPEINFSSDEETLDIYFELSENEQDDN